MNQKAFEKLIDRALTRKLSNRRAYQHPLYWQRCGCFGLRSSVYSEEDISETSEVKVYYSFDFEGHQGQMMRYSFVLELTHSLGQPLPLVAHLLLGPKARGPGFHQQPGFLVHLA